MLAIMLSNQDAQALSKAWRRYQALLKKAHASTNEHEKRCYQSKAHALLQQHHLFSSHLVSVSFALRPLRKAGQYQLIQAICQFHGLNAIMDKSIDAVVVSGNRSHLARSWETITFIVNQLHTLAHTAHTTSTFTHHELRTFINNYYQAFIRTFRTHYALHTGLMRTNHDLNFYTQSNNVIALHQHHHYLRNRSAVNSPNTNIHSIQSHEAERIKLLSTNPRIAGMTYGCKDGLSTLKSAYSQ
ncbi:DUF2786 domain-containing protein [Corynebacterium sp. sy039]|uniref:DUF2786 domain-containing protein n=1 Tax=Corynebacterium sp. sy039 TaxID=2599641 RepID=UPI0011B6053F|nr:DUF2786 domain-containing protein [Corynebacterium sp. sy039]QDZ42981.1 DUF2786 domain-containing protein [Corynebacterium sp. sy039]